MSTTFSKMYQDSTPDFQVIFNTMPGNFLVLQPNSPLYNILAVSDDLLRLTNTERNALVGRGVFEVFPENPEASSKSGGFSLRASLLRTIQDKITDQVPVVRYDIPNAEGIFEERYWSACNKPVLDAEGNVLYIIHTTADVTERMLAEQKATALTKMEKTYSLFMQAPVAICIVTGPDYKVGLANEGILKILRRDSGIVGKPLLESIPEFKDQGIPELLDEVLKTAEPNYGIEFPTKLIHKGKEELRYYNFVLQPYFQSPGDKTPAGVFCVAHDVTEQVLARRKIEEAKDRANLAIEAGELGVFEIDLKTNEVIADERVNKIFGFDGLYSLSQYEAVTHPEDLPLREVVLKESLETGILDYESRIIYQNKSVRWIKHKARIYLDEAGQPSKVIGVVQDITEQKSFAEELKKFKLISDHAFDAFILMREDGTFAYLNDLALERWGYRREEALTLRVPDVDPIFQEEKFNEAFALAQRQKIPPFETLHKRKDGTIFPVEVSMGGITLDGKPHMFAVARDITERKQAANAVTESEEYFRTFANNIQNLAWMATPDGRTFWYNKRWYDYTGTTFDDVKDFGWSNLIHPDYINLVNKAVKRAMSKDNMWELVFPLRGANGHYRWFLARAYAVRDAEGQIIRWIGTNTDIQEQKEAEEELQIRNKQLQKTNNDLDNFIYTASHDLKAPVSNIEGLVNTLVEDLPENALNTPYIDQIIEHIRGSIARFKSTINDLTDISKLQRSSEEDINLVNLQDTFNEIIFDLDKPIKDSNARFKIDFSACPSLRFSKKNLRSIIYNLVSNSIKYRSPDREPLIQINSKEVNGCCLLTVEDNGLGMDLSQEDKIFSMFKRLHDHVEGSGVGLYIVKRIIENNGGKITVESEVGKGSIFKVYLPVH